MLVIYSLNNGEPVSKDTLTPLFLSFPYWEQEEAKVARILPGVNYLSDDITLPEKLVENPKIRVYEGEKIKDLVDPEYAIMAFEDLDLAAEFIGNDKRKATIRALTKLKEKLSSNE